MNQFADNGKDTGNDASHDDVILVRDLVKNFGEFEAVRGVSFTVARGQCFGLLGPNGAGKTSIVKMVYGFSPVTAGVLRVFGREVASDARRIKAQIGVIPQEDNLDPELSVLQNLLVYAGYFRIPKEVARERALEILDFMELTEKEHEAVNNLSGGLKRRLTLGRALINHPELLILDEPTTGLDPYARHMVWQRLRKLKENGTTMLLTTHYLEEASQLCDRIVIMHQGRILEEGVPQELVDRHVGSEVLEMGISRQDQTAVLAAAGDLVKDHQLLGDSLLLFTNQGESLSALVSSLDGRLISMNYRRLRPSNLEDVFLKLTGETFGDGAAADKSGSWG